MIGTNLDPEFAALVAEEYASFERSPNWELTNIVRALNVMPWRNTERETARLQAVESIQYNRRVKGNPRHAR